MMKTIVEQIRLFRLQRGLSQENMADSLGISTTAYGDIERGKTDLTLSRFYQIAAIFGVNSGSLLGEDTSIQQEIKLLELEKLQVENEKLRIENQYLKEKLAGRVIVDLVREKIDTLKERQRIGF